MYKANETLKPRRRRSQRRRVFFALVAVLVVGTCLYNGIGRTHTTNITFNYVHEGHDLDHVHHDKELDRVYDPDALRYPTEDDLPVPPLLDSAQAHVEVPNQRTPPQKDDFPLRAAPVKPPLHVTPKKGKGSPPSFKPASDPKKRHRYGSNGLVSLEDADARHPIPELIEYATKKWEEKLKRASTTLKEAVTEYERRYRRSPPKGFDKWWSYVKKHDVQLPDEYDQIYRDLEHFWGMSYKDLTRIQTEYEAHQDSYTLGKLPDSDFIAMVNYSLPEDKFDFLADGAMDLMELMAEIEADLPSFRAVFTPHDNPDQVFDWETKNVALNHAARGTYMDAFNPQIPTKFHGWISACDPMSPAWKDAIDFTKPAPAPTQKTFIHDHAKAMDPCQHPTILRQHGQFLSHHKGPVPNGILVPSFSYSPSPMHLDITFAHRTAWRGEYEEADDVFWEEKYDERLEWRGRNTGIWHGDDKEWELSHRIRMIDWSMRDLRSNLTVLDWRDQASTRELAVQKVRWGPAMLDMGFVATPDGQCAEPACSELKKSYPFQSKQHSPKDTYKYKYIMDVDGNGWSSRFRRLMASRSMVFKSTVYPEWWLDRAQAWVHYVPVQNDYSDLWDALAWFRGGLAGEGRHDEESKKVGEQGRMWVKKFWRKEDMTAYNYRLILEYARVMSPDREAMTYNHWEGK